MTGPEQAQPESHEGLNVPMGAQREDRNSHQDRIRPSKAQPSVALLNVGESPADCGEKAVHPGRTVSSFQQERGLFERRVMDRCRTLTGVLSSAQPYSPSHVSVKVP